MPLGVLYFHMLGLKRLTFDIKSVIYLPKLALKQCVLSVESFLCSRIKEAKSKKNPESPFSEIFGKSFLLGVISRYCRPQKHQ